MSNQNANKNTKLVLVAGILVIGLLTAVLVGSFPLANRAAAQESELRHPVLHNNTSTVKPTVSATGTATTSVKPDKVSVTVGVETNGTTAEAASENADLVAKMIAALKALGIKDEQISTSNYSVYPVYGLVELLTMCRDLPTTSGVSAKARNCRIQGSK